MTSDYPPPAAQPSAGAYAAPSANHPGGVGVVRHLLSAVIALVAVPVAYVGLDYSLSRGLTRPIQMFGAGLPPAQALVGFTVAVVLLLVAAASGRLSGLGPLLAGVVWGVVPALWILLATESHLRFAARLPDVYDGFALGITGYGSLVYAVVAATLLGCAVSARWR